MSNSCAMRLVYHYEVKVFRNCICYFACVHHAGLQKSARLRPATSRSDQAQACSLKGRSARPKIITIIVSSPFAASWLSVIPSEGLGLHLTAPISVMIHTELIIQSLTAQIRYEYSIECLQLLSRHFHCVSYKLRPLGCNTCR